MRTVFGSISGLLFGFGLSISGMTDVNKVLGFLDVFGQWDITLIFVMGGGLLVTFPAYALSRHSKKPILDEMFHVPDSQAPINKSLIIGAVVFGIGWGLYGYCPGPAIASLAYGQLDSVLFLVAMTAGMLLASKVNES